MAAEETKAEPAPPGPGAAARESREASARPDGDHDVRVSAALWFELQRRARRGGAGDASDLFWSMRVINVV